MPKFTSDEIFFDSRSARLTNIAKAILDGIALRMKNDLNSTAVITGYSDHRRLEQSNLAISAKRAVGGEGIPRHPPRHRPGPDRDAARGPPSRPTTTRRPRDAARTAGR